MASRPYEKTRLVLRGTLILFAITLPLSWLFGVLWFGVGGIFIGFVAGLVCIRTRIWYPFHLDADGRVVTPPTDADQMEHAKALGILAALVLGFFIQFIVGHILVTNPTLLTFPMAALTSLLGFGCGFLGAYTLLLYSLERR